MKITLEFSDGWEFRQHWEETESNRKAANVLRELRDTLREVNKHGEPTARDTYWYNKIWEICGENDLDGWSI